MRLTTKLISTSLLLLLALYLIMVNGCGKAVTGRSSGGCPDSTAPEGSKIIAPTNLGSPFTQSSSCFPTLGFTVTDSSGNALSGICVEIYSDVNIALHSGAPDCSNVASNPQTAIVTRTDGSGNVMVELLSGPTPTGTTHFVSVSSGAIAAVATTGPAK